MVSDAGARTEILALDMLEYAARARRRVTLGLCEQRIMQLRAHPAACRCGRCGPAAEAKSHSFFRVASSWQRSAAATRRSDRMAAMTKTLELYDARRVPLNDMLACRVRWPCNETGAGVNWFLDIGVMTAKMALGLPKFPRGHQISPLECAECRAQCHYSALAAIEAWTLVRMVAGRLEPGKSNTYTKQIRLPSTHDEFMGHFKLLSAHLADATMYMLQGHRPCS